MAKIQYTETVQLADGHSKGITSVAFNHDGTLLATSGLDGAVCIWETSDWKLLDIYYAKTPVLSIAWFNKTSLVCGLKDGVLSSVVKDGDVSGFSDTKGVYTNYCPENDSRIWILGTYGSSHRAPERAWQYGGFRRMLGSEHLGLEYER